MTWTQQDCDKLTALWAQGLTASEIAAKIPGASRNTVIDKAHRLGLQPRTPAKPVRPVRRDYLWTDDERAVLTRMWTTGESITAIAETIGRPATSISNQRRALGLPPRAQQAQLVRKRKPLAEVAVRPERSGVAFEDLGPGQCRFHVGDGFCGEPATRAHRPDVSPVYCPACAAIVYQPQKPRAVKRRGI